MHKQLMLIPRPPQNAAVTELSEPQRKAIQSALVEALLALTQANEKEKDRDAEQQQD